MARADRLRLIRQLQRQRGSRVLVAVWGDRQHHETVIASDTHPVFFEHLQQFGKVEKIDLLLYTTGGHTLAAWGIANLLREYCDKLAVLIPHRAYSAGTLLAISADEIVMSRNAQLSPIDPSITSPLGPAVQVPTQPGQRAVVPISVEDAVGFLDIAKNVAGLRTEQSLLQIFDRLSAQVHPLALGAVYRSREQIQMLAERLLSFHMTGPDSKQQRERIVSMLTRELGSHDYLIGRTEARGRVGLNVVDTPATVERQMLRLFDEYARLVDLRTPYNAEGFLGSDPVKRGDFVRAVVESKEMTHVFRTTKEVRRVQMQQPGIPIPLSAIQETISFEAWVKDETA